MGCSGYLHRRGVVYERSVVHVQSLQSLLVSLAHQVYLFLALAQLKVDLSSEVKRQGEDRTVWCVDSKKGTIKRSVRRSLKE